MARLLRKGPPKPKVESMTAENAVDVLATEFRMGKEKVLSTLRSVGINLTSSSSADEMNLYREVIACKVGDFSRFKSDDEAYLATLDEQLRAFDEIYVDTAPIIQEDWFLHLVSNAEPILKRRKKKLIVLEKTMEELHGLKDNPEKDKEVRVRSTIRPDLLRYLARKGIVRIGDTGSTGIADDHLVELFESIGKNNNLMLITQDRGLSERVVALAQKLESEPSNPPKLPWWKKLFGGAEANAPIAHRMVACKLIEDGKLKRCYICPECIESYYDDLIDCEGYVLCSRCYMDLKEKEAKQVAATQVRQELELKKEEARQKRLREEASAKEQEKPVFTVAQALERRRKKFFLVSGLLVVIAILITIEVFILTGP
ncbi:hypothetical protein [Sphaerochaeta sp. PS]|uniref:hypothetical protein n=1 Tax=Sphaerochaeta sp. PS TaxID=3076336 RepID=UPI0028A4947A|nr:hypothetical protein [Sphaerochaeta sp. PS]MDT4761365.1 hypothetical protein [Sphaerochaeta sp. PS]